MLGLLMSADFFFLLRLSDSGRIFGVEGNDGNSVVSLGGLFGLLNAEVKRRLSSLERLHNFSPNWTFSRKLLFSSRGVMAWTSLK